VALRQHAGCPTSASQRAADDRVSASDIGSRGHCPVADGAVTPQPLFGAFPGPKRKLGPCRPRPQGSPDFVRPAVTPLARARPELLKTSTAGDCCRNAGVMQERAPAR
jgi:hypothetical protein